VPNRPPALLAVLAHPDDETYRAGGTLALLARRGVRVHLLCATRGEAGIPEMSPDEAGRVRQAELECACRALGIEPPRFLDYQDGTLAQVDEEQAIEQVVRAVRELRPQVLLTWPPDGVSGHPDHVAVSRWTGEAFRRASDPLALYHIVVPRGLAQTLGMTHLHTAPDEEVTLTVDVGLAHSLRSGHAWEQKLAAIRCHRSQMSSAPILDAPEEKRRLFLGTEHFRLRSSRGSKRDQDILGSWLGMDAGV